MRVLIARLFRLPTATLCLFLILCPVWGAVQPPGDVHDRLTVSELLHGGEPLEIIHNAYFAEMGEVEPARHDLFAT